MKRIIISIMCILALMLSIVPTFADASGVTNITSTKNGTKLEITWTNPEDFVKNIIYITKNESEEEPIDVGTKTEYCYETVQAGDSIKIKIETHFADETTAYSQSRYFARTSDAKTIPNWQIMIFDEPDFGITKAEKHDGNYAAYFNCPDEPLGSYYYTMTTYPIVKKDTKYRVGFWFKTSGYEEGASFKYTNLAGSGLKTLTIGDEYADGNWYYIEQEFSSNANTSKNFVIQLISKGTFYLDTFVVDVIDDEGNVIENNTTDGFERELGVKNITASRSGNVGTIQWTNPTDEDFLYNEIYQTYNGRTILLETLTEGETYYNTDVTAGGGYRFTVKSCYEGGLYGEASAEIFQSYLDRTTFPGWSVDVRDANTYDFRGEFGIVSGEENVYHGKYAAYFNITHPFESGIYLYLFRGVTYEAGKKYCLSYWIKTEDYGTNGTSRIVIQDPAQNDRISVALGGEDYPNGQWNNYKTFYNPISPGSKNLEIFIECYGKLWLDNIEVYEVDDSGQRIGDNLVTGSESQVDGSFESSAFDEEPAKVNGLTVEAGFRKADFKWKTDIEAEKIRVYDGTIMLKEADYADGMLTVDALEYKEYQLEVCTVSKYGAESKREAVKIKPLPYFVGKAEFTKKSISKGSLSAKIAVANDSDEELKVAVILALYDGKKLEKIDFITENLTKGTDKELVATVEVTDMTGKNYSAVAHVWDDFYAAKEAFYAPEWLKQEA